LDDQDIEELLALAPEDGVFAAPPEVAVRMKLVEELRRFDPDCDYCILVCEHPEHTTEAYRQQLAVLKAERGSAGQ
jgi:hypothetical protein